jgi:hypothetical protein
MTADIAIRWYRAGIPAGQGLLLDTTAAGEYVVRRPGGDVEVLAREDWGRWEVRLPDGRWADLHGIDATYAYWPDVRDD